MVCRIENQSRTVVRVTKNIPQRRTVAKTKLRLFMVKGTN
jgi:hypothetical protein